MYTGDLGFKDAAGLHLSGPRHWIVLDAGKMPLNRVVKPDYRRAQEMALQEIAQLRARGQGTATM